MLAPPLAWVRQNYAVDVQETKLAGVRVAVVVPKEGVSRRNAQRVLINLRGGGFIFNAGLSMGLLESIPVASIGKITSCDSSTVICAHREARALISCRCSRA